jgi:uroporphyrinogen-III synthase
MLARAGFTYRREALYEALPARALSAETAQMVGKGEIAIATFFSPRTAATFANVVLDQGVAPGLRATTAVCLSAAVAEALGTLSWARVVVADRPTPETFGAALDRAIRAAMCGQERETLAEQDRDGPGKR